MSVQSELTTALAAASAAQTASKNAATAVTNAQKVITNKGGQASLKNAAADILVIENNLTTVIAQVNDALTSIDTPTPTPAPTNVTPPTITVIQSVLKRLFGHL